MSSEEPQKAISNVTFRIARPDDAEQLARMFAKAFMQMAGYQILRFTEDDLYVRWLQFCKEFLSNGLSCVCELPCKDAQSHSTIIGGTLIRDIAHKIPPLQTTDEQLKAKFSNYDLFYRNLRSKCPPNNPFFDHDSFEPKVAAHWFFFCN